MGAAVGREGAATRAEGYRLAFEGLLPAPLLGRRGKASFDAVFFASDSRAFAAGYAGGGVPEALVDAAALRAHWLQPHPRPQSLTLLQAAWLAGSPADHVEQAPAVLFEPA
jgi:hypothetical protein